MILTLDLGSTNLKAAVFDEKLIRISEHAVETPYINRGDIKCEIDVAAFWQSCIELISAVCEKSKIKSRQLRKISITSQAQTFTLLDQAGKALIPFITWEDKRANTESEYLKKELGSGFHQHCSFSTPLPALQLAQLLWLKNSDPNLFDRSHKLVSLPGFLVHQLTGKNLIDRNLAAMCGVYSLKNEDWWSKSLDICGLLPENLPLPVNTGSAVKAKPICKEIEFSGDVEFILAGNDQTAGAYGNNAQKGHIIATLGTALVAYRYAGIHPGPYSPNGCWGPYPYGGYYELAVRDEGTSALDWARNQLMPGENITSFFEAAEKAFIQLNAQSPLFFPDKKGIRVAWRGTGNIHEKALSVLIGIGFLLKKMIRDDFEMASEINRMSVIGGGSRSEIWLQILANILNCQVQKGAGDSLLGAAKMAEPGITPLLNMQNKIFTPDTQAIPIYETLYKKWEGKF